MALQKFNLESLFDFILVFVLHVQLGYFNHYYYLLTYLKKKENNSYALYLISKIICDRPFFPFFTCIKYWIDPLRNDVILLLRTTQILQGFSSLWGFSYI